MRTFIFLACILLIVSACVPENMDGRDGRFISRTVPVESGTGSSLSRKVRVGGDHDYPPFEYLNEQGEPDGFNTAIVARVAEIMNLDIEVELTSWSDARRRLETGEVDMLQGMYRTPARDQLHDFTIPLFVVSYGVFTTSGSAVRTLQDVDDATILVHRGDLAHDYVVEEGIGREVVPIAEWSDVLEALETGRGEVAIFGMGQGMREIRRGRYRNIYMLEEPLFRQPYGMAVRKGDADLLAILNEGLGVLKSTGEFDTLYEEWFGILERPPWWTTTQGRIVVVVLHVVIGVGIGAFAWVAILRRQIRRRTRELTEALNRSTEIQNELRDANDAKLRFLANVSHELRTPLHGIIGMTDILGKSGLDGRQLQLVRTIEGASQHLSRILLDLLEISRTGAGGMTLEPTTFRLQEMVDWIDQTLGVAAVNKKLQWHVTYAGNDVRVLGDRERIAQIIINLGGNAIKFTDDGTVSLALDYRDDTLFISVSDTGPGIPDGEMSAIFEPFTRGTGEPAITTAGLGIGLAIVKTLVDLHGGTVTVVSEIGEGSQFDVTLPLPSAETIAPAEKDAPAEKGVADGLSVLIVEDEAINRIYLSHFISRAGAKVEEASDGVRAAEAVTQRDFDVILMDISMPHLDGISATRRIRAWEHDSGASRHPIIALSAHAFKEQIDECYAAGMDGFLSKPYREFQVWAEIRRVLQQ